jgi:hypothetical protein
MKRASPVLALFGLLTTVPCRAQGPGEPAGGVEGEPAPETSEASTASVERCVSEHERAHMLRIDEHWLEARAAMAVCAAETCPLAIRSDCRAWLDELAQALPTLLVVVERDDGGGPPVRVELDGHDAEALDPSHPIEVIPGPHHMRFLLEPYPPVETDVVAAKGEKNRLVTVRFAREPPPPPPLLVLAPPAAHHAPTRPIPVASYAFAGGALVAFATSTALLVSALSMRSEARSTCAPVCGSNIRRSIDTRLLLSDISGAVGVTLAGLTVYTFVSRPTVSGTGTGDPSVTGAAVSFSGSF